MLYTIYVVLASKRIDRSATTHNRILITAAPRSPPAEYKALRKGSSLSITSNLYATNIGCLPKYSLYTTFHAPTWIPSPYMSDPVCRYGTDKKQFYFCIRKMICLSPPHPVKYVFGNPRNGVQFIIT